MSQVAMKFSPNPCPKCGGELDYTDGSPGHADEPASVGTTYCLDCDYRQPDPDAFERLVEQADERNDAEWLAEHAWDRQLAESD